MVLTRNIRHNAVGAFFSVIGLPPGKEGES